MSTLVRDLNVPADPTDLDPEKPKPPSDFEKYQYLGRQHRWLLAVQAIEIRHGSGLFWGTQYHPELDLDELAAMLRLSADAIVEAGLAEDPGDVEAYAGEVAALHGPVDARARRLAWRHGVGPGILDAASRRREIGNFLDRLSARRTAP